MNKLVNDQHPHIIDAGEGHIRLSDYTNVLVVNNRLTIDFVVYSKAVRRVGRYLGMSIGDVEIRALAIIQLWCWQHKKPKGGSLGAIVGWSGYTKSWKAKVHWGIRKCLELELLNNTPVQGGGNRLGITKKGQLVLSTLEMMGKKVLEEMDNKLNAL